MATPFYRFCLGYIKTEDETLRLLLSAYGTSKNVILFTWDSTRCYSNAIVKECLVLLE